MHGSVKNLIGIKYGRLLVVGKYQARIGVDGRRIHLGYFDSIAEAAAVRVEAQRRLWSNGQAFTR